MDQNRKEELLTLWMDDALSAGEQRELEPYLAQHPELVTEREEFLRLREELRAVLPAHIEPPYPDFFNTHLMRQIREEEHRLEKPAAARSPGMWNWMRLWLVPGAAAAVVVAFLAGLQMGGTDQEGPVATQPPPAGVAPAAYSSLSSVDVQTWEDRNEGVTVIVLDGLAEIPSSVDLMKTTASLEGEDGVF